MRYIQYAVWSDYQFCEISLLSEFSESGFLTDFQTVQILDTFQGEDLASHVRVLVDELFFGKPLQN